MVYTYYYSTGRDLFKKLAWLCYLVRKFSQANILALCVLSVNATLSLCEVQQLVVVHAPSVGTLLYLMFGCLLVSLLTDDDMFQTSILPLLLGLCRSNHPRPLSWWLYTLPSPHTPPWGEGRNRIINCPDFNLLTLT